VCVCVCVGVCEWVCVKLSEKSPYFVLK